MKLIIDTDTFNDSEYDTLTSCLKEKIILRELKEELKTNKPVDLCIILEYKYHKSITGISKKFPRDLLLKLVENIEIELDRDIKDLLEHIGGGRMKFTSEDLLKSMGLKVGDRIKLQKDDKTYTLIDGSNYEDCDKYIFVSYKKDSDEWNSVYDLTYIIDKEMEFDILPTPKRVGDLKCLNDIKCEKCPLSYILCESCTEDSLYEVLEYTSKKYDIDKEIYDLLKTKLDKEIEDDK